MASRLGTPNNQGFLFTIVVMEVQTAWGGFKDEARMSEELEQGGTC